MPRLFQQAGLSDIWIEGRLMPLDYAFFQVAFRGVLQRAQAAGSISEEELSHFWKALEQAEQEQHFFARVGGFVVSGTETGVEMSGDAQALQGISAIRACSLRAFLIEQPGLRLIEEIRLALPVFVGRDMEERAG